MLKICMVEACKDSDRGSIGAFYVRHHAGQAGYKVDALNNTKNGYDIELISIHHASNFWDLAKIKKRAKFRIVGGHPMQNNPLPAIPLSDVICIGEAETWIKKALKIIDETGSIDGLKQLPGTIVCKDWKKGDEIPTTNIEIPLPENPPYLNHERTNSKAWYVEMARGCPFSCHYCELGHSTKYRPYPKEHLKKKIDEIDISKGKKINFYAPDEASHPDYNELYDYLYTKGFAAAFSSMRVDTVIKNLPKVQTSHLIRIGVDGLTEETRFKVNKKITDDQIVQYFKALVDRGHVNFKIFMIVGYPWEKKTDYLDFFELIRRIRNIPLKKNIMLRIKWTPFIPQPCTPLGIVNPTYTWDDYVKILQWHENNDKPRREPGIWITNDGLMTPRSHKKQVEVTRADETYFKNYSIL